MTITVVDGKVRNPEGLEINAVVHCNMRCRSCSHLSPLFRRSHTDPVEVHETLAVLANYYHASYAKILGGEPLLHPDVIALIDAVRASNVSDSILVCTNGILLGRATTEFWESVDAVEVSVYPSRPLQTGDVRRFHGLARDHDVDLTVNYYGAFRVAYSEDGTHSEPLVERIFATCKLAHFWYAHTMHAGLFYRCPQSVFIPQQLSDVDWDGRDDCIEIVDDARFFDQLLEFTTRTKPLRACRHCLGSVGVLQPHAEVRPSEWRQHGRTEDLVDYGYLEASERDISTDDGCVDPVCPRGG